MSGLFTALGLPCSILLHRRKIPFTSFWSSQWIRSSKPFITSNSKMVVLSGHILRVRSKRKV